ncbi:MAG: NAD(P)H-dependent glycerol-3-phosphate dehydrogenase [Flavobacteriales bacterium]|nr:NAD(P)H-dependent glycerol-3-phosphate dehydrogenase [Flavobacteriales bacterium]
MSKEYKIGVIGGGSWATALIKIFSENLDDLWWWNRNAESISHIEKYNHNPKYLSSAELDVEKLNMSTDLNYIAENSDILIMAIPSAFIFNELKDRDIDIFKDKILISAIKGIIPEENKLPAIYFNENLNVPFDRIGIISGPCHAEEVAMERLSYLTVAVPDQEIAEFIVKSLDCRYIKAMVSDDVAGTEISAVLKNVFAVASGICAGLGYGDNFQAVLVSNALREIKAFVDRVKPQHRDVNSSAYLGDLLVTAYSSFSRNRNFGSMIGKGYSVKAAHMEMNMVAEGYYAVKGITEMNKKYGVEMPITEAVYNICYEKISPVIEMHILSEKLT